MNSDYRDNKVIRQLSMQSGFSVKYLKSQQAAFLSNHPEDEASAEKVQEIFSSILPHDFAENFG